MTDEQKMLMQLTGYDDDMFLMDCIAEIGLKIEELKKGYYQKYFRKDLKRAWGFNCYHCSEKVKSDKDESYYIVSITWKDPNAIGRRFCSKDCADIFFNESMYELLKKREEAIEARSRLTL